MTDPWLGRARRGAEAAIIAVSALLLAATMAVGALDVALGMTIGWYFPAKVSFSEVFVAAAAFLALPAVTARDGHVRVDVLTSLFGPRMQAVARLVTALATAAVCLLFAAASWQAFAKSWAKAETVQAIVPIPLYPVRFCAALAFVACAGIAAVALARTLRASRRWRAGNGA
ncbi:TRAP transporter small permease [uncultured Albimonas sp.]|uniref:TRAP transporter small permease n=1 Tax=uncultured Albimonas sp. TaxID=1331701 RepID=UPI0030EB9A6F|tara:strand:- start:7549 stop:8064 length:516 start_codon:yes stop_codon:yes gene_type:complete